MATRFYLSPVIGSGTEDDPYRPKIAQFNVTWSAQMASDENGSPMQSHCIAQVDAEDFTDIDAAPEFTDVTA